MEASYRLKLKRALEHLHALDHVVKLWAETDPCSISYESEVATRKQTLTQRVLRQPSDPLLPLLIGDTVHNMRQGIDHLAYQLAIKVSGKRPPPNENASMWPIRTKAKLASTVANDIGPKNKMPTGMYAAIERFQTDAGSDGDLLAVLNALDNGDKHRLPPLIAGMAHAVDIGGFRAIGDAEVYSGNVSAELWSRIVPVIRARQLQAGTISLGAFRDGEVIVRADEIIAEVDTSVHMRPAASIAFAETYDVAPGELVLPVLKAIHDTIANRVIPSMEQFL